MKNANKIIIALMLAAVCAGAASCDGDKSASSRKTTYVTAQENETTEAPTNDYVAVTVDGLDVLYSGWIKMPTGKEYINLLNSPDEKYLNGYAYPDFPADVYKEEGDWLLVKTKDKVGYIPKTNFTQEAPAVEGHVEK